MRSLEETSKEAEPDKDFKLAQRNEISIAFSLFGALSMKQISEQTNIKINAITWRFHDDRASDEPMWRQVGTFPIKGRRFKIFDLIKQNEFIGKEIINKEFYEYLSKQQVKENMTQEKFESYREKCPECNEEVWVQKSKGGNLYYTQNDWKGKNYKERPNWHSEYCNGRPKQPIQEATAPPKKETKKEPKRSVLGTVFPSGKETTSLPKDFQISKIPLSEQELINVERSLIENLSHAIATYIKFSIDKEFKRL